MSIRSVHSEASVGSAEDKYTVGSVNFSFGLYKGTKVAIRNIQCGPVLLTRNNLLELKTVIGQCLLEFKGSQEDVQSFAFVE